MNQHTNISVSQLTLSDVLDAVDRTPELSATRKRDLLSDVKAVVRWLDRPASSIEADAAKLRDRINALHHVQIGVSQSRLRNVISSLRAAIKLASAKPVRKQRTPYRTPEWMARLAACEKDWERHRLAGLATYCSEHGICEDDVDDAVIQSYRNHLNRENLRKDPDKAIKKTIQTWNRLIDQQVTPHLQRLTPTRSNFHWTTPLTEFPQAFQTDLDRWLDRLSKVDILSEDGPPKALRPQTIENIRVAIRKSATALVITGTPIESITSLAVLVELRNFRTILRFFLDRDNGEIPTWLHGLASQLVAIARHQVKLPAQELDALVAMKARTKVPRDGLTEKNKVRLGQFEDPRNTALLVQLPAVVAARVQGHAKPSRWDALDVMHALSVDILLAVPMRRFNLASIDIERHIIWRGHGAGRFAQIMIPGNNVKNEVAIEGDLPKETSRLLRTYLDHYRLLVSVAPENWLFPKASGGAHRSPSYLANRTFHFIRRETGLEVNAHLFRHLAGMLYLMRFPGQYEVVRRMLGHKSVDTTIRFYTSLESKWALKRYDEKVLSDWRNTDDPC